jgi:hypothetical protein
VIPEPLLVTATIFELGVVLAAWLLIVGHGAVASLRKRSRRRIEAAHRALAAGLLDRELDAGARARLRRLRTREAAALFADFAPHLRGAEREWLAEVAVEMGLVKRAGRLCRSRLWWRRLYGARILTLVGGATDAVLGLADDPNALVRSQVAEWAGAYPSDAAVIALTAMLGDRSRSSRFAVQDALVRLGGMAVQPLAGRLADGPDPLAAITGLRVARGLGDPRLLEPTLALSDHGRADVRAAAYAALGSMGGREAATRLVRALDDPDTAARAAAVRALGRLGHWQAGPAIARQLDHTAWDVRLAAGRALVALGPPGRVILQQMLDAPNTFVADMARHVLDSARLAPAASPPSS